MSAAPIEIVPERGGAWGGRVYTGESTFVQPDAEGRFATPPLPPSSVVGLYTFKGAGISLEVYVPEGQATASLENLLKAEE